MKDVLSPKDRKAIAAGLMDTYGAYLDGETFSVRVLGQSDSIAIKVTLDSHDHMSRHTFEISAASKSNGITLDQAFDLALDFLGFYLDRFFENNREDLLPLDYHAYDFGEYKVYARGDFTRPKLDDIADKILRNGEKVGEVPELDNLTKKL